MPETGPMSSLLMLLRSELFLVTLNSTPEGKAVGIQAPTYTGIMACSAGVLADLDSGHTSLPAFWVIMVVVLGEAFNAWHYIGLNIGQATIWSRNITFTSG